MGRCLTNIDVNNNNFALLPPHFKISNPLEDEDINEALNLMYGQIMITYKNETNNSRGLLVRLLASVVYQSDWIEQI